MNIAEKKFSECINALENGDWPSGMKLYHWRYNKKRSHSTKVSFPKLPLPFIEHGSLESFRSKSVLVLNEQGLGDEFMFFRGLHYLMEVASAIAWQAYPETVDLLKLNAPAQVQLFTERQLSREYLTQFDCYTTTGNLFSILSAAYPAQLKYFLTTGEPAEAPIESSVGVCWATNPKSPNGACRSIDVELLKPLIDDADVYSLTKDAEAPSWIHPCQNFQSFLETAQFMSRLTNIVTVDTSVAHVAGSIGKPTVILIKDHFDWRWRYVREDNYSVLYPTVKVILLSELLKAQL